MKSKAELEIWKRELDLMEQWFLCMTSLEKMVANCEAKITSINNRLEEIKSSKQ